MLQSIKALFTVLMSIVSAYLEHSGAYFRGMYAYVKYLKKFLLPAI
jgi:hypothetical protein